MKSLKHFPYIVISSLGVFIYSIFIHSAYELIVYIWSLLSLIFVGSVALRIIFLRRREDILFFTIIFMTWLNFLQPYLKPEKVTHLYRVIPDDYLFEMSFFSALGVIALYFGYYFGLIKKNILPFFYTKIKLSSSKLGNILLLVLFFFIVYKFFNEVFPEIINPFIGVLSLLDYAPGLISAGLTLIILRKKGNILTIVILVIFLMIQFFIAVAQTLFVYVAIIVVIPFLIYFFERKRFPVIFFLVTAIIISPIYLLRHYYRRDAFDWWYNSKEVTTSFLVNKGISIIGDTYSRDDIFNASDKLKNSDESAKSRFESVSYLGQCVFQHKIKGRPYMLGETFWWLPIVPIPRAILPFKPENKMSTELAEDYGLKGHTGGSMNWPMLAEFFINFGFFGMIFLSFFQGMAYKFIFKKIAFGKGDLNLIILFSIILPVTRIEGNITLIFGQIFQFFLIWYILSITFLKTYRKKNNYKIK